MQVYMRVVLNCTHVRAFVCEIVPALYAALHNQNNVLVCFGFSISQAKQFSVKTVGSCLKLVKVKESDMNR